MSSHTHGQDEWFSHGAAEVPQSEHTHVVNTLSLFKWLMIIVVSLVIVIAALFAYFDNYISRLRSGEITKNGAPVQGIEVLMNAESNAAKAAADEALGIREGKAITDGAFKYRPVEGAPGKVTIPVDAAMEKVIKDYGAK